MYGQQWRRLGTLGIHVKHCVGRVCIAVLVNGGAHLIHIAVTQYIHLHTLSRPDYKEQKCQVFSIIM